MLIKPRWLCIGLLALSCAVNAQDNPSPRWVVAGGSLVEFIYALGQGDTIVGVDQTSTYPETVSQLPQIGYWKQLNSEGILSLNPTGFITWQDAGPSAVLEQLASTHLQVLTLPRVPATLDQMYLNIQTLADTFHIPQQGQVLISDIQQRLERVAQANQTKTKPIPTLFILSIGKDTPMVAGKDSVADQILTLAGADNLATHKQYKPYSGEAIVNLNPEVLIVTKQMVPEDLNSLAQIPGITLTKAWQTKRIITIDQSLILGMGPRITEAVEYLHQQLLASPEQN